jgi:hypothetical protein
VLMFYPHVCQLGSESGSYKRRLDDGPWAPGGGRGEAARGIRSKATEGSGPGLGKMEQWNGTGERALCRSEAA